MTSLVDIELVRFEPPVTATEQPVAVLGWIASCAETPAVLPPAHQNNHSPPPPPPTLRPHEVVCLSTLATHHTPDCQNKGGVSASRRHDWTPRAACESSTQIFRQLASEHLITVLRNISFNNEWPFPFRRLTDSDRLILLHRDTLVLVPQHVLFEFILFLCFFFYTLQFSIYLQKVWSDSHPCSTKSLWPWNNADWTNINVWKVNITNSVQKQQTLDWCWLDFAAAGSNRSSHQSSHGRGCVLQLVSLAQWKRKVTTSSKTAHC